MTKTDAISDRILRVLSREGRIANTELADRVGLSPSACLRRVQELERSGVIKGYRAVVDPMATGGGFTAFVSVDLESHTKQALAQFEQAMDAIPEVRECHNITGEFAYLLRVETTDLTAYKHFHTDKLSAISSVTRIASHIVMGSPKDDRA